MQKLTKAEEEIMHIIWALGPCTVSDMRDYIHKEQGQKKPPHSTISTIVRILEEKEFLTHKAYGRTYEYRPLITKEEYSSQSLRKLVSDYFGGSMRRLVSFMVQKNDLSLNELSEMMELLEKDRIKNQKKP